MVNSGKPTKHARHIDIKQFSIIDWVETDLLSVEPISTHDNISDAFKKVLARILFHCHNEIIMGKVRPSYSKYIIPTTPDTKAIVLRT